MRFKSGHSITLNFFFLKAMSWWIFQWLYGIINFRTGPLGSSSSFGKMASHYLWRLFDMRQNSHWFSKTTPNCNIPATSWYEVQLLKNCFWSVPCQLLLCLNNSSFDLSVQSTLFSSSLFTGKRVFLLMFFLDSKVLLLARLLYSSNLCDVFMNIVSIV